MNYTFENRMGDKDDREGHPREECNFSSCEKNGKKQTNKQTNSVLNGIQSMNYERTGMKFH